MWQLPPTKPRVLVTDDCHPQNLEFLFFETTDDCHLQDLEFFVFEEGDDCMMSIIP